MCIVVYKPKNKNMPSADILRECFNRNPDGAGYMFPEDNKVIIKKGYMHFKSLYKDLIQDYLRLGKKTPFVIHFRIQTQGGINQALTHPFALSKNMNDLRELYSECDFGVAHNGIISLTSTSAYSTYYDTRTRQYVRDYNKPDYSDTMKFITDYLSLIIREQDWYKDDDKLSLIEKLAGYTNKFAVMDWSGHTTLIGNFIEDNGIYYSNSTYQPIIRYSQQHPYDYDYDKYYNEETGEYDFPLNECPCALYGDYEMCDYCGNFNECMGEYIKKEIENAD